MENTAFLQCGILPTKVDVVGEWKSSRVSSINSLVDILSGILTIIYIPTTFPKQYQNNNQSLNSNQGGLRMTIKIYYSISFFPVSEETRGKLFPQLQSFSLACSPPACIFIIMSCVFTRTHYYQHYHPTIHMIIIIVYPILGQGLFLFSFSAKKFLS